MKTKCLINIQQLSFNQGLVICPGLFALGVMTPKFQINTTACPLLKPSRLDEKLDFTRAAQGFARSFSLLRSGSQKGIFPPAAGRGFSAVRLGPLPTHLTHIVLSFRRELSPTCSQLAPKLGCLSLESPILLPLSWLKLHSSPEIARQGNCPAPAWNAESGARRRGECT
jgi:hypothetical protein